MSAYQRFLGLRIGDSLQNRENEDGVVQWSFDAVEEGMEHSSVEKILRTRFSDVKAGFILQQGLEWPRRAFFS